MPIKQLYYPFIFGAALTGSAIFIYPQRSWVLISLMLFLPLLDKQWTLAPTNSYQYRLGLLGLCCFSILGLLGFNPDYASLAFTTLTMAALPEEWFFRGYLINRIEHAGLKAYQANIITALFFALLHLPTQGWFGLSVLIPALIYGWIYQKTRDIILVILLHALSNIVFFIYIQEHLKG